MLTESKFPRSFVFKWSKNHLYGVNTSWHPHARKRPCFKSAPGRAFFLDRKYPNNFAAPTVRKKLLRYALVMASCSQFVSHALCGIALIHQIPCVQWSKMVMGLRNNLLPTQVLWLVMGLRNTCQGNSFIQESRRSLVSKSWLTRGLSCTTKILNFFE